MRFGQIWGFPVLFFSSAIPTQFRGIPLSRGLFFASHLPSRHTFNPESRASNKGNPGSRKTYLPLHLAGSTFLHINTLACPARSTQSRWDNQNMRECCCPGQKNQRFSRKTLPKVGTVWRVMDLTFLHINFNSTFNFIQIWKYNKRYIGTGLQLARLFEAGQAT